MSSVQNAIIGIRNEMNEFQAELAAIKKDNNSNKPVDQRVFLLEEKFNSFSIKVFDLLGKIDKIQTEFDDRLDELEQYSRRNCIVIHGIAETQSNEDCADIARNLFLEKLNVDVPGDQICRAHRLGNINRSRTMADAVKEGRRPIIVKFVSYKYRSLVFYNKSKLKNTGILITESLTKKRLALMNDAVVKVGRKNVFTSDGRIFVTHNNNRIRIINNGDVVNLPNTFTNTSNSQSRILTRQQSKFKHT